MTALSIQLSEQLALDSLAIAKELHISRSHFIRLAIENEVKAYRLKHEQNAMAQSFQSMKRHPGYLARLDPSKHAEVGKMRPVIILMAQLILDVNPLSVLICPLSSQSHPDFSHLHVSLPPRDNLQKESYALVEHCRSISVKRLVHPRLAQLTFAELQSIFSRLQLMCGM